MTSRERVRTLYDRRGARQDRWRSLTEPAIKALLAHADFASARTVFELGCGNGRLAERLLTLHLPVTAAYTGVDLSENMVNLARQRLERFGGRVAVRHSSGDPEIDAADAAYDRVVAAYSLELLPRHEIEAFIAEAHRVLADAGLLCVACVTEGPSPLSRVVGGTWRAFGLIAPGAVGGGRALDLGAHLDADQWRLVHTEVLTRFGVPSRVLVAAKCSPGSD